MKPVVANFNKQTINSVADSEIKLLEKFILLPREFIGRGKFTSTSTRFSMFGI